MNSKTTHTNRRLNKTDYRILMIIGILFVVFIILLTRFKYTFGSKLDWSDQHFAIPEYLRTLFYKTGNPFPSFAPNLGAGENIYYLSYYGLFSPFILISYLLPFVPMSVYIPVGSAIMCYLGAALFYRYLRKSMDPARALTLTIAYLTASPIIFHAHRHIMFVIYMPFFILAMEAVDSFFQKKRRWPLVIWTLCIILCNWFFSVSALVALTVYGLYRFFMTYETFDKKLLIREGSRFALHIITAVFMAGVLLLPTVHVLLSGRDKSNSGIKLTDLIPRLSTEPIGYSPYSMGLGCFAILAMIAALFAKGQRGRRFLGIVLAVICCCPFVSYALNGTMYIESKVFIPFIPLALILCGNLLDDLSERKLPRSIVITFFVFVGLSVLTSFLLGKNSYTSLEAAGIVIDTVILLVVLILFYKKNYIRPFLVSFLALPLILVYPLNYADPLVTLSNIDAWESPSYPVLSKVAYERDNLWRTSIVENRADLANRIPSADYYSAYIYSSLHHKAYNTFYFEEMHNENEFRNAALTTRSQNPFFVTFMSERYLIGKSGTVPYGYETIAEDGTCSLYENKNVLPLGRTKPTLGEDIYENLAPAEKMEALTKYVITGTGGTYESSVEELGLITLPDVPEIKKVPTGWRVTSDKLFNASTPLPYTVPEGKLLVIEMTADNTVYRRTDARVTINGIRNTLTAPDWKYYNNNTNFTYVLPPCTDLDLIFTDGDYLLSEIHAYLVDAPQVNPDTDALQIDKKKSGGDCFIGTITCRNDSYFELAIPYDTGFRITVDGQEQEYSCVDTSFIGFPIKAGEHTIEIVYKAPLLNAGLLLSAVGTLMLIGLILLERRQRKKERSAA